jgi:hypothetical protein
MSTFKLRGSRVLLDQPDIKEPVITLSPEDKKAFDEEQLKKFTEIKVFAVGSTVDGLNPGDFVYVSPYYLQQAQVIEIEGEPKLLIREQDIDIIW